MQEWIAKVWPSNFYRKGFISSCCFFVCCVGNITSCKKMEKLFAIKILFRGKSKVQPVIFILQRKINFPQLFLHEEMFLYFWREICEQILFNFFVEKVARGNSVQIAPNFPAKSLSIYTSGFFQTPFKLIKILDVKNNCCLSTCFIWDIKQIIKSTQQFSITFIDDMLQVMKLRKTTSNFFLKIGACVF